MVLSNPGSKKDVTKDEAETMLKRMTKIVGILDEAPVSIYIFYSPSALLAKAFTPLWEIHS